MVMYGIVTLLQNLTSTYLSCYLIHGLLFLPIAATHTPRETPTPAHTSPHFQDHRACDDFVSAMQHDNNSDNALPPKLAPSLSSMSSQHEPPLEQAQSSHKPAHSSSSAAGTTSIPGDCDRSPSSSPNSSNSSTSRAAKSSSSHKPPPYGGPQQSSLKTHPQQSSLRPHPHHHNPAKKTSPASAHIPSSMV